MAVLMGATMAVVLLAFMWRIYENATANAGILAAGALHHVAACDWFSGQALSMV